MATAPYIGAALPVKIVETDGERNLFQYAATELGDPLLAWQIAALNGLTDYWPAAGIELKIPRPAPSNNDGIPS